MKKLLFILLFCSSLLANFQAGIRPMSVYDARFLWLTGLNATQDVNLGDYGIEAAYATFGNDANYTSIDPCGVVSFNGMAGVVLPHLMQSDTTDQAIANVLNAQIINFNTDVHHNGITRTDANTFTITKAGSYLITFSGMAVGTNTKVLQFWLKKNSDYLANSNTQYTFKGTGTSAVVACSFIEHFDTGDYFEFWTWGDDVSCKWDAVAAGTNPTRPAIPSIIITANYVGLD